MVLAPRAYIPVKSQDLRSGYLTGALRAMVPTYSQEISKRFFEYLDMSG